MSDTTQICHSNNQINSQTASQIRPFSVPNWLYFCGGGSGRGVTSSPIPRSDSALRNQTQRPAARQHQSTKQGAARRQLRRSAVLQAPLQLNLTSPLCTWRRAPTDTTSRTFHWSASSKRSNMRSCERLFEVRTRPSVPCRSAVAKML
jgi:hypothetical protein